MSQDPFHLWRKTIVGHAICFVKNDDLNIFHGHFASLHQVNQAQWCRNNEFDSFIERVDLIITRGSAVDSEHTTSTRFSDWFEHLCYLQGQFTSGHQHHASWCTHLRSNIHSRHHRHSECKCLARASSGASTHVDTTQCNRYRFCLDCKWCSEAGCEEAAIDILGYAD